MNVGLRLLQRLRGLAQRGERFLQMPRGRRIRALSDQTRDQIRPFLHAQDRAQGRDLLGHQQHHRVGRVGGDNIAFHHELQGGLANQRFQGSVERGDRGGNFGPAAAVCRRRGDERAHGIEHARSLLTRRRIDPLDGTLEPGQGALAMAALALAAFPGESGQPKGIRPRLQQRVQGHEFPVDQPVDRRTAGHRNPARRGKKIGIGRGEHRIDCREETALRFPRLRQQFLLAGRERKTFADQAVSLLHIATQHR